MEKKSNVNDIFQNDNNGKNKTKTILLLVIVAIILIAVFLIIAWVMTRENPMQTIQNANNANTKIINPTPAQNPIPYAHNLDNNPKPNTQNNANDALGLGIDSQNTQNMGISTLPPLGVKTDNTPTNNTQPPLINATPQGNTSLSYQNDPAFQHYNDIVKQEQMKQEQNKQEHTKKDTYKQESEKVPSKVITPLPPKETPIVTAPDPTKTHNNSTQKPKETNSATQKKSDSKESSNTAPKKSDSKDTKNHAQETSKEVTKKPENKITKPDSKDTHVTQKENPKSTTQASKPTQPANTQNDPKIIQRPVKSQNKEQGTEATKGFYIQVGSFAQRDKIDQKFLTSIAEYSYRTKVETKDGKTTIKYLIGPYKERTETKRYLQDIKTKINPNAFFTEIK